MIRNMRIHTFHSTILLGIALVIVSPGVSADSLHAAVLHLSKGDRSSFSNSYVATLINDSDSIAKNCRIEIGATHGLKLGFWTTNRVDNVPIGERNAPTDILARGSQSFLFSLSALEEPDRITGLIFPVFVCDNRSPASSIEDTNSIDLEVFGFSRLRTYTDEELAILPGLLEKMDNIRPGGSVRFSDAEMGFLHRNGLP